MDLTYDMWLEVLLTPSDTLAQLLWGAAFGFIASGVLIYLIVLTTK